MCRFSSPKRQNARTFFPRTDRKEAHLPKWTGCLWGRHTTASSAGPGAAVRTGCSPPASNLQNWTFLGVCYPERSQSGGLGVWGWEPKYEEVLDPVHADKRNHLDASHLRLYLVLLMSPGLDVSISGHICLSMSQKFWVLNCVGHTTALHPTCEERSRGAQGLRVPATSNGKVRKGQPTFRSANSASCSWYAGFTHTCWVVKPEKDDGDDGTWNNGWGNRGGKNGQKTLKETAAILIQNGPTGRKFQNICWSQFRWGWREPTK